MATRKSYLTAFWSIVVVVAGGAFAVWQSIPDKDRSELLYKIRDVTFSIRSQEITLVSGLSDIGITDRSNLIGLPYKELSTGFVEVTSLPPKTRIKKVLYWGPAPEKTGQNSGQGQQLDYTVERWADRQLKISGKSLVSENIKLYIRVFLEYESIP